MRDHDHPDGPAAEWVPVDSLRPWDRNPRVHGDTVDLVAESIRRFGWGAPILARRDGTIIAGHARYQAARKLGLDRVPVRRLDLDDDEAAALALADNKLVERSAWDDEGLADILRDLDEHGFDVESLGWSPEELEELRAPALDPAGGDEDDVPEPDEGEPVSRPGELYQLGPHRLVCGDATEPADWDRVLDGETPTLVLTDPPYGVEIDYDGFDDTDEALRDLARKWFPIARKRAKRIVFTPGIGNLHHYPPPTWMLGWFYRGTAITRWGFNMWQPVLVYGPDPYLEAQLGGRPDIIDSRGSKDPIQEPKPDHLAPKPLAFWIELLERVSVDRRDVVVDPFGGSGTTLIACAQTGRVAHLIEQSPRYCDVIRRRWARWAVEHGADVGDGIVDGG